MRNSSLSGYDIIAYLHNKFNVLISSGTVYTVLYSMERDELIKGGLASRKRVYTVTDKGKGPIKTFNEINGLIQNFMEKLVTEK